MQKILITGATGNVGIEVIKSLHNMEGNFQVFAGLRKLQADDKLIREFNAQGIYFDLADEKSVVEALDNCDTLFLLRPPQLSDVKKYFYPIIKMAKGKNVKHIVFLSVQGADTSSMIPHHKIEKLIIQSGINYTFLRPAYFMQNFTTSLRSDVVNKNKVYLPAGNVKFALIDVEDLGKVAAKILTSPGEHINKAYDLTNEELLSFKEMSIVLSHILGKKITFVSPNLLSFYLTKRREGFPPMYILVMIMLHYLPRFQKPPKLSDWVEQLTHKKPGSFADFVKRNRDILAPNQ